MGQVFAPLGDEAVLAQRLILGANLDALLDVGGKTQTAGAPESIAGERLQADECGLGALPELACRLGTVGLARHVVPRRPTAKSEATVSPARALRNPARVVDADSQTSACERERAGAARYPCADDGDVHSFRAGR